MQNLKEIIFCVIDSMPVYSLMKLNIFWHLQIFQQVPGEKSWFWSNVCKLDGIRVTNVFDNRYFRLDSSNDPVSQKEVSFIEIFIKSNFNNSLKTCVCVYLPGNRASGVCNRAAHCRFFTESPVLKPVVRLSCSLSFFIHK